MGVISAIKAIFTGHAVIGWVHTELHKALMTAADEVAQRYGDVAKSLVQAADAALSNPEKLFDVATKLVAEIEKDGIKAPFGVAVVVAQAAYEQVKQDALGEVDDLLDALK